MEVDETIVAIASTHDAGGLRGIVRISGPDAINVVSEVFQSHKHERLSECTTARRLPGLANFRAEVMNDIHKLGAGCPVHGAVMHLE